MWEIFFILENMNLNATLHIKVEMQKNKIKHWYKKEHVTFSSLPVTMG